VSVTVVLDTEAVSLLTPQRRHDPGRRHLLAHLEGADNVITPSVVRVEALVPRDARHADVNRLVRDAEDLPQLRRRASDTADAAARARSSLDGEVEVVHAVSAPRPRRCRAKPSRCSPRTWPS